MARHVVPPGTEPLRVAVIGAGLAGAACAAKLLRAGIDVTVFDKSRGVGGRMATRRVEWTDTSGASRSAAFDHGCGGFAATGARFRAVVDDAVARGAAVRTRPWLYARFPAAGRHDLVVGSPDMPAFCRHLLHGVPLRLGDAVTRLVRDASGWRLHFAERPADGPFDRVVIAIPSVQAAALLRGHRDDWADMLTVERMAPCWTLLAVTDDVDWPWDIAELERGELAVIARADRTSGRARADGAACWVAHSNAAWSREHLEDDPATVRELLCAALGRGLAGGAPPRLHHAAVHRWRFARCTEPVVANIDARFCAVTGVGICGDAFGDGVEAAWTSGDDLAGRITAPLAVRPPDVRVPREMMSTRPRQPSAASASPLPEGARWAP